MARRSRSRLTFAPAAPHCARSLLPAGGDKERLVATFPGITTDNVVDITGQLKKCVLPTVPTAKPPASTVANLTALCCGRWLDKRIDHSGCELLARHCVACCPARSMFPFVRLPPLCRTSRTCRVCARAAGFHVPTLHRTFEALCVCARVCAHAHASNGAAQVAQLSLHRIAAPICFGGRLCSRR